jgi:hypothetical protein
MKKLLKKPFLAIIIFFLSPSAFSQTSSNSPLFNCVELAQQIQNRASTTNLPFNGNVEDYANSFIEKIVVAAYVDYISNLFSTAKRDVSQQERESIANQAVDCMRNIKWNFNNPKTSANSAKNESANLAAVALFLGMLESSSGSSNNSSSYSNQNVHNSYQCNRCALVSRSTKKPLGGDFGRCNGFELVPTISGISHDWKEANTNKGWQCTGCGIKSFLIKGEPGGWEFGGSGACNGGSHYWRSF